MKVIFKNKLIEKNYYFNSILITDARSYSNIWKMQLLILENGNFYIGKYYFYTNRSKAQVASYYGSILGRILYLSEITQ